MRSLLPIGLAVATVAAAPAAAQSWTPFADGARQLRTQAAWQDDGGIGPFFYPSGYDPQYGSEGRVADAEDFAADYGCRPIWNAKTGRLMPACN